MNRILPAGLLVLLVLLQYRLWAEPGGVMDMLRLRKHLAETRAVNAQMKADNETLQVAVHHLRHEKDAVESSARENLGMIHRGEIFYQTGTSNENIIKQ